MVINIVDNVDNFVDKLWISLENSNGYYYLYVIPTFGVFLGVFLGYATTLWVKMGLKMGWCTTFETFEFIRETDTTEPYIVLRYIAPRYIIASWNYCDESATADQPKRHYNTVLL